MERYVRAFLTHLVAPFRWVLWWLLAFASLLYLNNHPEVVHAWAPWVRAAPRVALQIVRIAIGVPLVAFAVVGYAGLIYSLLREPALIAYRLLRWVLNYPLDPDQRPPLP
jgi:hypothetical protein